MDSSNGTVVTVTVISVLIVIGLIAGFIFILKDQEYFKISKRSNNPDDVETDNKKLLNQPTACEA